MVSVALKRYALSVLPAASGLTAEDVRRRVGWWTIESFREGLDELVHDGDAIVDGLGFYTRANNK